MSRPVSSGRPWIITALAALALLGVVEFPLLGYNAYLEYGAIPPGTPYITVACGFLAYGLWTGRAWARIFQMIVLVPMMFVPPIGFSAMILLGYMGRAETRRYFVRSSASREWRAAEKWSQSEWPWVLSVILAFMAGVGLMIAAAPLFRVWR